MDVFDFLGLYKIAFIRTVAGSDGQSQASPDKFVKETANSYILIHMLAYV